MVVIYVYDKDWNALTQIFNARDVEIALKLSDFGEATFVINADHPANTFDILQEFNQIKIARVIDGEEKIYFDGYLQLVEARYDETEVQCRTREHYLDRRQTAVSFGLTQDISISLQTLIDEINGLYDTGITLDCRTNQSLWLNYRKWESVYGILKKLSESLEFTIIDKVLIVDDQIGDDRSSWQDFVQLKLSKDEPDDRNVKNFSITRDANDIANAIQGKSSVYTVDAPSVAKFGRIDETITNNDTSETQAILDAVQTKKESQPIIDVKPDIKDFMFASLWDTVAIDLNAWNPLGIAVGTARIYEKSIKISWLDDIDIKLTETKNNKESILDVIRSQQKRIARLELS